MQKHTSNIAVVGYRTTVVQNSGACTATLKTEMQVMEGSYNSRVYINFGA